ncbi:hypothetical protein ACFOLC_10355 [Lysobacter cavernae]|uniref:Uncharacterized protein n=1 Tax=Lysobacter cavernae TaxID=1685901 RepID=A0ABV7RPW1_9GAMM
MFRTLFATFAVLAATAACAPLSARPLVEVAVIDRDRGDWLPPHPHRGQHWITGTPGHRYSVRLTNTSSRRVLAVLAVDGVNAVSGETAHPSQAGYVLGPWQSTQIHGWRKSLDDVAQFVFTDLADSYAARTGRPDHVGVIGVAVFEEARPTYFEPPPYPAPYPRDERERASSRAEAPAAAETHADRAMQPAPQSIGTGHGAREWSPVARTGFVRASRRPAQLSKLRYDDYTSLVARGVLRPYPHVSHGEPRAFPDGFVADPPGG